MADTIHWADVIAEDVLKKNGKHLVATGITPSGNIHIGNMREVVTADAVYRALVDKGANADFIYIADNYDPLRKVYPFLPESYVEHVGKPISEIPCPCGNCANYAEHKRKGTVITSNSFKCSFFDSWRMVVPERSRLRKL